jgi:hypothetical protein
MSVEPHGSFMKECEVWLAVPGYEGLYEASNLGRIRRDPMAPHRSLGVPGQVLSPVAGERGYLRVSLSRAGTVSNHAVHRLVLMAFCGPPPFHGAHAAHNDGHPTNCALSNLRWATPTENQADVDRHGRRCRGEAVFGSILTEDEVREIRRRCSRGEGNPPIAGDYGVSRSTIHLIRHNRIWRHVR